MKIKLPSHSNGEAIVCNDEGKEVFKISLFAGTSLKVTSTTETNFGGRHHREDLMIQPNASNKVTIHRPR